MARTQTTRERIIAGGYAANNLRGMGTTRLETVEPLRALNAETLAALALSTLACSRTRVRASVSALTSASGSSGARSTASGSGGATCSRSGTSTRRSSTSTRSSRAVVATSTADGEVDDVVEETVLCLSDEDRLMVGRSVDATKTVDTGGEASGDVDVEVALRIRGSVHTLEERELGVVEGRSLGHALELLNDEVRVANNVVLRVKLLRRRVVVSLSVDEVA